MAVVVAAAAAGALLLVIVLGSGWRARLFWYSKRFGEMIKSSYPLVRLVCLTALRNHYYCCCVCTYSASTTIHDRPLDNLLHNFLDIGPLMRCFIRP